MCWQVSLHTFGVPIMTMSIHTLYAKQVSIDTIGANYMGAWGLKLPLEMLQGAQPLLKYCLHCFKQAVIVF